MKAVENQLHLRLIPALNNSNPAVSSARIAVINKSVMYSIVLVFIFFLLNWKMQVWILILAVGLFVATYFAMKYGSAMLYEKAYFKADIKNKVIQEDVNTVRKRLKTQFILFMLVAFMFGTQPEFIPFFFILITAFLMLTVIKVRLAIRNERAQK